MKNTNKYIIKLLVDFIKVDRVIYSSEIEFLKNVRKKYCITRQSLNEANNITLEECIDHLKKLPENERREISGLIDEIIQIDNNVHIKELFLKVACKLALEEATKDYVQIISISASTANVDFYSKQIIYLEKQNNRRLNKLISSNFLFLSSAFKEVGLEFFYFPEVICSYRQNKDFMHDIMDYLVPTYSETKKKMIVDTMDDLKTIDFMEEIRKKLGERTVFKFESFLFFKIQNSYVLDQSLSEIEKKADFLCFDISRNFGKRIKIIIDHFRNVHPEEKLSYSGYYRILFEMLSNRTKESSGVLFVKNNKGKIWLMDLEEQMEIKITQQQRILYLLYIIYQEKGLSRKDFQHASQNQDAPLVYNIKLLYNYFCVNKDRQSCEKDAVKFIKIMSGNERNTLHTRIKSAFDKIKNLENKKRYYQEKKDHKDGNIYRINIPLENVYIKKYNDPAEVPIKIRDSDLWRQLK